MARKTTKAALVALERFRNQINYLEEVIRVKTTVPIENQAAHVQEKSLDYWYGRIDGAVAQVEDALFDNNCYHGFHYVAKDWSTWTGPNSPEFAEYRRQYNTRIL